MKTIVTIGREYGSGGRIVAQRLAEKLGVPFYDKEVIQGRRQEDRLCGEFRPGGRSAVPPTALCTTCTSPPTLCPSPTRCLSPSPGSSSDLADKGGCVIVGRCADLHPARAQGAAAHLCLRASGAAQRAREEYHDKEDNLEGFVIRQDQAARLLLQLFHQHPLGRS